MSEVGGGETVEQVLDRLNNRSEYSAVRGTCMAILFVAAWAANLYIFKVAHIDISSIYPAKLLTPTSAGGAGGTGPDGGGRIGGSSGSGSSSSSNGSISSIEGRRLSISGHGGGLAAPHHLPLCHPRKLAALFSGLAFALALCALLMSELLGQPYQHAPLPFIFLFLAAVLYPFESTQFVRGFCVLFGRVLWRVVFPRPDEVLFLEVLVGDILTSLSKVFHEMGLACTATLLAVFPGLFDAISPDLIPALFASVPFLLRIRQCAVQVRNAPTRRARLTPSLNILKYCSSLPGIFLPLIMAGHFPRRTVERVLLWALLANSLYSFGWDVVMDWGLGHFKSARRGGGVPRSSSSSSPGGLTRFPGLRPTLLFGAAWPYYGAIAMDLALRLLWALKYVGVHRRFSYDAFMLLIEALEVLRRGVWSVFRIEWECLSLRAGHKAAGRSRSDDEGMASGIMMMGGAAGGGSGGSATDLDLELDSSAEEGIEVSASLLGHKHHLGSHAR